MALLYHMVPREMWGTTLYPLNDLRRIAPEMYERARAKYVGRKVLLTRRIPTLDCLWNDVLHLTTVHPVEIKRALMAAGSRKSRSWRFFQIDPRLLDPTRTTVFLATSITYPNAEIPPEEFVPFDPADLDRHASFPQATRGYFTATIAQGERPLLFAGIPHILHRGRIDVAQTPIIDV